MPFVSQNQRAFMHIHHPKIADRWEEHTPKGKKLPKHVPNSEATVKKSAFYGHGVAQAMLDVGMVEKVAWPWSRGGQGVSTVAQNYHPDTVARAQQAERGQPMTTPRPNLPPQIINNAPAPARSAPAAPAPTTPRLNNERAFAMARDPGRAW